MPGVRKSCKMRGILVNHFRNTGYCLLLAARERVRVRVRAINTQRETEYVTGVRQRVCKVRA